MIWLLLSLVFLALIVLSWWEIRRLQGRMESIYAWGFLLGAFVWEDLLLISIYGLIGSLSALVLQQTRIGLLFYIIFWIVRSGGETMYFFLQQFFEPKHNPHYLESHFGVFRRLFGKISYQQCLIMMQVSFQIVLMVAIICLILLLSSWESLGRLD